MNWSNKAPGCEVLSADESKPQRLRKHLRRSRQSTMEIMSSVLILLEMGIIHRLKPLSSRKRLGRVDLLEPQTIAKLSCMENPLKWVMVPRRLSTHLLATPNHPRDTLHILVFRYNWRLEMRVLSAGGIVLRTEIGIASFALQLIRPRLQRHCFKNIASHPSGLDIQKSSWARQGIISFAMAKSLESTTIKQWILELCISKICLTQPKRLKPTSHS